MNADAGIFNWLKRVIIVLIAIAILVAIVLYYIPIREQNRRMLEMIVRLDNEIKREEMQEKELRAWIDALRNDPKTVERLLRESGFAKPGETIFRFEQSNSFQRK
jgi:cell division protein FtsB